LHHIDLIFGAILQSKPCNRMNPKYTQEVQRLAKELLVKEIGTRSPKTPLSLSR